MKVDEKMCYKQGPCFILSIVDSHLPTAHWLHLAPWNKWYTRDICVYDLLLGISSILASPLPAPPIVLQCIPATQWFLFVFDLKKGWSEWVGYIHRLVSLCYSLSLSNSLLPVSSIIFKLSNRLSSYTLVPATSLNKAKRSWSFAFVRAVTRPCGTI